MKIFFTSKRDPLDLRIIFVITVILVLCVSAFNSKAQCPPDYPYECDGYCYSCYGNFYCYGGDPICCDYGYHYCSNIDSCMSSSYDCSDLTKCNGGIYFHCEWWENEYCTPYGLICCDSDEKYCSYSGSPLCVPSFWDCVNIAECNG